MIVSCPACGVRYVFEGEIGVAGRALRCNACTHTWHYRPQAAAPEVKPRPNKAPVEQRNFEPVMIVDAQNASPLWLGAIALSSVVLLLGGAAYIMRTNLGVHAGGVKPLYKLITEGVDNQATLRDLMVEKALIDKTHTLMLKGTIILADPVRVPVLHLVLADAAGSKLGEREFTDYLPEAAIEVGKPLPFRVVWSNPPAEAVTLKVDTRNDTPPPEKPLLPADAGLPTAPMPAQAANPAATPAPAQPTVQSVPQPTVPQVVAPQNSATP